MRETNEATVRLGAVLGDQPSSASAGRRGKAMNSTSFIVTRVSDQSGPSTPMMLASVTAGRSIDAVAPDAWALASADASCTPVPASRVEAPLACALVSGEARVMPVPV